MRQESVFLVKKIKMKKYSLGTQKMRGGDVKSKIKFKRNTKLAFTLMEMLIVIVIIGILAGVILPKIMGVMSRARDTKRVADLRNVAMSIESYKMDYGEYPRLRKIVNWKNIYRGSNPWLAGSVSSLKSNLWSYISDLPRDPNKNTYVDIIVAGNHKNLMISNRQEKWEYLYQLWRRNWEYNDGTKLPDFALLIAKMETPWNANYVLLKQGWIPNAWTTWYFANHKGADWAHPTWFPEWTPFLCSSIKKVQKWKEKPATTNNSECAYSSEEQLYYIVKI